MSAAKLAIYAGGLAAAALGLSHALAAVPGGQLSRGRVRDLVLSHKRRFPFPNVQANMARAIVEIESDRRPYAIRPEPHIQDFSVGLMQTLVGTARWLHDDMGFRAYPRPDFGGRVVTYDLTDERRVTDSPAAVLFRPEVSVYYGMAYLQHLETHPWREGWEWVVRAYNGGPDGARSGATAAYWDKYRRAEDIVLAFDQGHELPEGA